MCILYFDYEIFCLKNYMNEKLPLFAFTGSDREDAKLRKSVSAGYATELLNIVVHHSDNVAFLQKYGAALLAIGEQGRQMAFSLLVSH